MTVGSSNATMSEKSRLETCEKQIVALTRAIKQLVEKVAEQQVASSNNEEHLQDLHEKVFDVEYKVDQIIRGDK